MEIILSCEAQGAHASFARWCFDTRDFSFRPRCEWGRATWGDYFGAYWLGLSVLVQRKRSYD